MNVVGTSYFDTWANYQVGYDLISQSVVNNTSKVKFYGVLNVTGNNISWSWANASVWGASNGIGTWYGNGSYTVVSQEVTITHKADGTYSGTLSGTLSSSYKSGTASGTFSLPKIDRIAVVSSVTDFNDESNPSITFVNPAGFRINAYLEVGNTRIVTKQNIDSTSPYTLTLNSSQRNQLRQLCTGKTLTVKVGIATCIGGTTETNWSYKEKQMTLVNANPTFTTTYQDTNASTLAITNNNQQIIQNNSTLQINIANAAALKYATLSSVRAEINGVTYNGTLSGSSGTINVGTLNLADETPANVILTDSRGLETTHTLTLDILEWSIPTGIVSVGRQNNFYSETDIKVDADYSSLDSKNVITLKVRTKKTTDQNYGAYTTLSDNVTSTLVLDNNYQWNIQVLVQDLIGSTTYNLTIDRGIPIVFYDRLKRSVGVDCFPNNDSSMEIYDSATIRGDLYVANQDGSNPINILETILKNINSVTLNDMTALTSTLAANAWKNMYSNVNVQNIEAGTYLVIVSGAFFSSSAGPSQYRLTVDNEGTLFRAGNYAAASWSRFATITGVVELTAGTHTFNMQVYSSVSGTSSKGRFALIKLK